MSICSDGPDDHLKSGWQALALLLCLAGLAYLAVSLR